MNFADGCGTILNFMPTLTGYQTTDNNTGVAIPYRPGQSRKKFQIGEEFELEIKQYLEFKGMLNYGTNLSENTSLPNSDLQTNPFENPDGTVQENRVGNKSVFEEV
jgi:hypothetical protein